jgi:hypothetical protein
MSVSQLKYLLSALTLVGLSSGAAAEDDRCGGVKLEAGHIVLGKPLSEKWVKTPEGKGCLADVVKEIERNRLVRAVTVKAIVSDADRAAGKGLSTAKAIAAALVDAGLPKNRVFGLAPAAQRADATGISLRYVERAPIDVAARVVAAGGAVFLGGDEASLKPAEPGMPVLVNELVKTGPNARVTVHMKDGSGFELKPQSKVKLAVLQIDGPDRQVKIEVLAGGITADVRKASQKSKFEASTRVAVASVRGTKFRFGAEAEGGARLETLEGVVAIGSATDPSTPPVEVSAGQGSVVSAEGRVSPPTALPDAPQVVKPLKGKLSADARFEWKPLAEAATYLVEVARDADFVVESRSTTVSDPTVSWPEPLAKGKWFWRVTAVNGQGFSGASSKVYAFTVGK